MSAVNSAVAVTTVDVPLFNGAPIEASMIETLEQVGSRLLHG